MKQYNNEDLLEELRRVYSIYKTSKKEDFDRYSKVYSKTIVRRFGSWFSALEKAGIDITPRKKHKQQFSEDDMIREIQRVYTELKDKFSSKTFAKHTNFVTVATIRRRFGSWGNAIKSANIENYDPVAKLKNNLFPLPPQLQRPLPQDAIDFLKEQNIEVDMTAKRFPANARLDISNIDTKITPIYPVYSSSSKIKWLCRCHCDKLFISESHVILRKDRPLLSCGCMKRRKKEQNPLWKGHNEISGNWWSTHVKARKNIKVIVTKEQAWDIYIQQNKRCALTGLEIFFGENGIENTASLDRIDSTRDYEIGNIQWVHKDINIMKLAYTYNYFVNMCLLVAKNQIDKMNRE